jgi:flagellar protein FlaG
MGVEQIKNITGANQGAEASAPVKDVEIIGSRSGVDSAGAAKTKSEYARDAADAKKADKKEIKLEDIKVRTEKLNQVLENFNIKLSFQAYQDINRTMVRVISRDNNKVLKEIPPEEMMEVLQKLNDYVGVLLDDLI